MIFLRRMDARDADWLADIGARSLLESHGHSAPPAVMQAYVDRAFSVDACRAELADAANVFNAAFCNGAPAGYSKIIFHSPHPALSSANVTKLERLYLVKDYYGLQLGHRLLQEAVAASKAAGDEGMWLNVWKENERALGFYKKQGFEVVGESQFALTETHSNPNWVMLLQW